MPFTVARCLAPSGIALVAAFAALLATLAPTGARAGICCADADSSGQVTSNDALLALRTSVELDECEPCRCDADDDGFVRAQDALGILRASIGLTESLGCPDCSGYCCGDGLDASATGLPTRIDVAECEELDAPDGGLPVPDFVEILYARALDGTDADLDVDVDVNLVGCFCQGLRGDDQTKPGRRAGTPTSTSTTSTRPEPDCTDCFYSVEVTSEVELGVVALDLDAFFCELSPGEASLFEIVELDSSTNGNQLEIVAAGWEECDDANTVDGDGCSAQCRSEDELF